MSRPGGAAVASGCVHLVLEEFLPLLVGLVEWPRPKRDIFDAALTPYRRDKLLCNLDDDRVPCLRQLVRKLIDRRRHLPCLEVHPHYVEQHLELPQLDYRFRRGGHHCVQDRYDRFIVFQDKDPADVGVGHEAAEVLV